MTKAQCEDSVLHIHIQYYPTALLSSNLITSYVLHEWPTQKVSAVIGQEVLTEEERNAECQITVSTDGSCYASLDKIVCFICYMFKFLKVECYMYTPEVHLKYWI